MNRIPAHLREQLAKDPEYSRCSLRGYGECDGRITWEHAIIFAGKQVQKRWAIIPLCERHHAVGSHQDAGTMDKKRNEWVALNRAIDAELRELSKANDYIQRRSWLNGRFGKYVPPPIPRHNHNL